MTDLRQAAQQALDFLMTRRMGAEAVIDSLTTALAQQAEPPPEWPLIKNILAEYGLDAISFVAEWKAAQRPWVGLTDEEIKVTWSQLWYDLNHGNLSAPDAEVRNNIVVFGEALEAKLKEKNNLQKPWVGLTDGDWEWVADKKETSLDTFAHGAAWAADQLKEKNT